jgi:O-methyltransferase
MTSSYEINENIIKKIIKKIFSYTNYSIVRKNNFNDRLYDTIVEINKEDALNVDLAIKSALCSKANLWSLIQSIKYIANNKIKGDFVECGVFRGGSLGILSHYAEKYSLDSKIYGFDTFEDGFFNTPLSDKDITIKGLKITPEKKINNFYPTKDEVRNNLKKFFKDIKYSPELIKGDVLKTLNDPKNIPDKISILRLDTDLYLTTKIQLETLYPKLVSGGILHIDDYGICPGVRSAVDEYFIDQKIWLHRIDLTCRLMIKV